MDRTDESLSTSKGCPARMPAERFPYKFPTTFRELGGMLSVEEAVRRLQRFQACHRILMRIIGGRIIQIPEFEVKIELAHHLYMHAEAARLLHQRLIELRVSKTAAEACEDNELMMLGTELEHAHNNLEFVAAIYGVVTRHLLTAQQRHMELTDKLADLPTIRILRNIRLDLQEAYQWGEVAVEAYLNGGCDENSVRDWQAHVELVLSSIGGITGSEVRTEKPKLRQETEPPFRRKIGCERDERFTTFHDTRDYRKADVFDSQLQEAYERDRLEMIRVQRDEIDAIETFANVLYDLADAPLDLQMDLARFIWDEARHAEIGHQSLARLGYNPFDIPCSIIGINVRSPLAPLLAFAQINTFGELNIVKLIRQLSQNAYQLGDRETGITFDFVYADELMHLRKGRFWLKKLHPTGNLEALHEEARIAAISRLVQEGVIGEDYAMNLTSKEIGELIGE